MSDSKIKKDKPTVRITVDVPTEMHKTLKELADDDDRSVRNFVLVLIKKEIRKRKEGQK